MNGELSSFILQIIGLSITLIGSLWKMFDYINKRFEHERKNQSAMFAMHMEEQKKAINRIYERMDERTEEADKTFVRLDVHNLTVKHMEEKSDEKFKNLLENFDLKIGNLTKAVNDLIARINKS